MALYESLPAITNLPGRTPSIHHAIDARGASQTLPAHNLDGAVVCVGQRQRPPARRALILSIDIEGRERDAANPRVADDTLLDKQDSDRRVLAQARGEDASGGSASNNDIVVCVSRWVDVGGDGQGRANIFRAQLRYVWHYSMETLGARKSNHAIAMSYSTSVCLKISYL